MFDLKTLYFWAVVLYLHRQVVRAETKTFIFACISISTRSTRDYTLPRSTKWGQINPS